MTQSIAVPQVFARAGLAHLKNNLVMGRLVDTSFTNEFRKVGDTVKAKRPPEFVVGNGRNAFKQDVIEGSVDVKCNRQKHIKVSFTSVEDTLSADSLLKSRVLANAMAQLAQEVDTELMGLYRSVYACAGTPGQVINSPADFFEAPLMLDNMAVPSTDRQAVLYPKDYFALAAYFTGTTQANANSIGEAAITKARIPMIGDVQPYKTQSVVVHTNGTWAGGALIKGANQTSTYDSVKATYRQALLIDDLTDGATLKVGDVFTIANVYAVNPRTKAQLDYLQQFVVRPGTDGSGGYAAASRTNPDGTTYKADDDGTYTFSSSGSAEISIQISPPIITSGAYQNVSAAPANDAAITLIGGSTANPQNLVFHRQALTLVTARLEMPFTGEAAYETDPDTGLSVRYWRYSSGDADEHAHRFDILFGATCLDNRLICRAFGTSG